jgi:hypothetical protein
MFKDLETYQSELVSMLGTELNTDGLYAQVKENGELQDLIRRIRGCVPFAYTDDLAFCVLFSFDYFFLFSKWVQALGNNEPTADLYESLAKIIVSR